MKSTPDTGLTRMLKIGMVSIALVLGSLPVYSIALAEESWKNGTHKGQPIAVTPKYGLHIYMANRPTETVWGKLDIPIKAEQLPELNKHLKSPNFPFIDVAIEVDKYYRVMQGRIFKDELLVSVELDLRQWDGLKKGAELEILLPEGTELNESLRGSGTALRKIERR